jgi:hypothetical protein
LYLTEERLVMKEKIPKDIEDLIESQTNPKVHEELKQEWKKFQRLITGHVTYCSPKEKTKKKVKAKMAKQSRKRNRGR